MKIKDLLEHTVDNRGKTPPTTEKGHILMEINCITGNQKYPDYSMIKKYVSNETYETWFRSGHPQKGDVLIPTVGTLNAIGFADRDDCCIAQNMISFRANSKICYNEYLYYLLCDPTVRKRLLQLDIGAVQPSIKVPHIKNLEVKVPCIKEQKKIAQILADIDNKIATNTAINKNLESQAKAIVKAYFIDFIPYGGTAPQGWSMVSLNDICEKITDGSHYSPVDSPEAPYPMYSVKYMRAYGFDPSSCKHITAEELQKMKQNDCVQQLDDILVAKDGSYLKEIFICSATRNEAILSSIAIFRPNRNMIEPEILLYFLKQPSIRKDVGENYVSGSALPRIVLKDFKKYPMLLPPIYEQHKISDLLHSYRMQIQSNVDEIDRLQTIRDTLLPRLMSGEIDVGNVGI